MQIIEVKLFTEFTVHRGSVVMIRFTILFLLVSIRLGSIKCKQKLSITCSSFSPSFDMAQFTQV